MTKLYRNPEEDRYHKNGITLWPYSKTMPSSNFILSGFLPSSVWLKQQEGRAAQKTMGGLRNQSDRVVEKCVTNQYELWV